MFCPGRAASHGLKSSTCRRLTSAIECTPGAHSTRNPANDRRHMSVLTTLRGRRMQAICCR